jgi:DNA-binding Lrp family transcriptional regulator
MRVNNHNKILDGVNLQIIDILSKDSSMPFVDIAKRVGISDATVHLKVQKLSAAGIITKFTISVDNNLLGYGHIAFMRINIKLVLQIKLPKNCLI